MAGQSTDFVRFSPYSIKELIIRKLSEDSRFTDQIYEGSNINVLIDLVAYMYQCLVYQLNNAASESMFKDTQVYENINRLVSMIGYNPRGMNPSEIRLSFSNETMDAVGDVMSSSFRGCRIKPYTLISTGMYDSDGNEINFSTGKKSLTVNDEQEFDFVAYNGKWKLYPTVFTASGYNFETFTLNIGSDSENGKFVSDSFVDVYVKKVGKDTLVPFAATHNNLFKNTDIENPSIYTGNDAVYNIRLNQEKNYEIKFGDGTCCTKLDEGDLVYIFYLESNGSDIQVGIDDLQDLKLRHDASMFGITDELYDSIPGFASEGQDEDLIYDQTNGASVGSVSIATQPKEEETVDEIRENAPIWFKTGGRLVTKGDYEYYLRNSSHRGDIIDVRCMGNSEYLATFYKWLYDIGKQKHGNGRYYLNQNMMSRYGYRMSDASDSNNVYLWVKTYGDLTNTDSWLDEFDALKTITADPVILPPITVNFALCAASDDIVARFVEQGITEDGTNPFDSSYVEITMDSNALFVNSQIQSNVRKIIREFFDEGNFRLGQTVDYNDMMAKIYAINGVSRIRTVYRSSDDEYSQVVRNGLCFATWSGGFVDQGDDMEVSNTSKSLEPFQFPNFYGDVNVKVIKKSITTLNQVQY